MSRAEPRDKLSRTDRAELQTQQRVPRQPRDSSQVPDWSQGNHRAEPLFEPNWDSNKAEPVPQPDPGLELVQYCCPGAVKMSEVRSRDPSPSWVSNEPIPEPGLVRTNPGRISSPEPGLERSPEPMTRRVSSRAPSPEEPSSWAELSSESNTEPIPEPNCQCELSRAEYRASSLVRACLVPELNRTNPQSSPSQASS